jgi:hypothetical protein
LCERAQSLSRIVQTLQYCHSEKELDKGALVARAIGGEWWPKDNPWKGLGKAW